MPHTCVFCRTTPGSDPCWLSFPVNYICAVNSDGRWWAGTQHQGALLLVGVVSLSTDYVCGDGNMCCACRVFGRICAYLDTCALCGFVFSAYILHTVFCWFFTVVYTGLALLPIERLAVATVVTPLVNVIAAAVLAFVVADPSASPDFRVRLRRVISELVVSRHAEEALSTDTVSLVWTNGYYQGTCSVRAQRYLLRCEIRSCRMRLSTDRGY